MDLWYRPFAIVWRSSFLFLDFYPWLSFYSYIFLYILSFSALYEVLFNYLHNLFVFFTFLFLPFLGFNNTLNQPRPYTILPCPPCARIWIILTASRRFLISCHFVLSRFSLSPPSPPNIQSLSFFLLYRP